MNLEKGKELMEGLLLNQYQNSPNFKQYLMAFVSETDELFTQVQEVYDGRLLDNAEGKQLDVIGLVLNQSRNIILPTVWFGFRGALLPIDHMSDINTPEDGGQFKSINYSGVTDALEDVFYRRLLKAKASVMVSETADINTAYNTISIILNRVPSRFILLITTSGNVKLLLRHGEVSNKEVKLIYYARKYFVPMGIHFTIQQD